MAHVGIRIQRKDGYGPEHLSKGKVIRAHVVSDEFVSKGRVPDRANAAAYIVVTDVPDNQVDNLIAEVMARDGGLGNPIVSRWEVDFSAGLTKQEADNLASERSQTGWVIKVPWSDLFSKGVLQRTEVKALKLTQAGLLL